MGSDDLFKKRREARKKRSHEFKTPKANSYLIVTEGECTEPYYFNGLKRRILDSFGGVDTAIKNAKRRMSEFAESDVPSEFAPGTTVHILVEELRKYLE